MNRINSSKTFFLLASIASILGIAILLIVTLKVLKNKDCNCSENDSSNNNQTTTTTANNQDDQQYYQTQSTLNNDLDSATNLRLNSEATLTLGPNNLEDYYYVDVPPSTHTVVTFAGKTYGCFSSKTYDQDKFLKSEEGCKKSFNFGFITSNQGERKFYIYFTSAAKDKEEEYVLKVISESQNDAESQEDTADDLEQASITLEAGNTYSGLMGGNDVSDFYIINSTKETVIEIYAEEQSTSPTLAKMYDTENKLVMNQSNAWVGSTLSIKFENIEAGKYYLKLYNENGSGSQFSVYRIDVK